MSEKRTHRRAHKVVSRIGVVLTFAYLAFLFYTPPGWFEWPYWQRLAYMLPLFYFFVISQVDVIVAWKDWPLYVRTVAAGALAIACLFTLLFALYCNLGISGYEMDDIMTAIIPPYSAERIFVGGADGEETPRDRHEIVVDSYSDAVARAKSGGKLLLVNFTGHT